MVTPVNVKRFQYVENTLGQAQLALLCCPEIASRRGEIKYLSIFISSVNKFLKKFNFFLALINKIYFYFFTSL